MPHLIVEVLELLLLEDLVDLVLVALVVRVEERVAQPALLAARPPRIPASIARSGVTVTRLLCFRYHTKMY
jgi:hypothetical protein